MLKIGETLNYKLYKSEYIEDHIPNDRVISFVNNAHFNDIIKNKLYNLFIINASFGIPNYCISHCYKQIFNNNDDIIQYSVLRCNIWGVNQTMDPEAGDSDIANLELRSKEFTNHYFKKQLENINYYLEYYLKEEDGAGGIRDNYTNEDFRNYEALLRNETHTIHTLIHSQNNIQQQLDEVELISRINSYSHVYAHFDGDHLRNYPHRVVAQTLCINKDGGSLIKAIHVMGVFYIRPNLNIGGQFKLRTIINDYLVDPEILSKRLEQYFVFNGSVGTLQKRSTFQQIKKIF